MHNVSIESTESKREIRFFFVYALVLLGIVLAGFAPSLYLRVAFDPPPIPLYLHIHGAILTGWFVWLVAQAWLVQAGNPGLHRKLGAFAAAYGLIVVGGALMATFNAVERDLAQGITFDTNMADSVLDLLAEINEGGTTIIMVTHELELADRARRNIFVRDGEVHDGAPELHFAAAVNA